MNARPVTLASRDVPAGQVETEAHGDGWVLVAIGRDRRTKLFNVRVDEIPALIEALSPHQRVES